MHSVGIDLHRKRSHLAVIDEEGEQLLSRRILNDPQTFLTLLEGIGVSAGSPWRRPTAGSGWPTCCRTPAMSCTSRTPCAPGDRLGRVKTDAVDARTLAHLLRALLLPEAHIAPRELRDLLRHRVALTRMRSAVKNRVSAVLAKRGIERPYSDLFGLAGTRFLTDVELREGPRRRLDSTLALIGDFTREIDAASREIDARAHDDPYVPVLC
jgi:transposase